MYVLRFSRTCCDIWLGPLLLRLRVFRTFILSVFDMTEEINMTYVTGLWFYWLSILISPQFKVKYCVLYMFWCNSVSIQIGAFLPVPVLEYIFITFSFQVFFSFIPALRVSSPRETPKCWTVAYNYCFISRNNWTNIFKELAGSIFRVEVMCQILRRHIQRT
jgi:hypothetical protein